MSHPQSDPAYDPLPLTGEDHSSNLYNAPPSPGPAHSAGYNTPPTSYTPDIGGNDLPMGAAQPRFMGNAMFHDNPELRQSMASTGTFPMDRGSEYNGSALALNEQGVRSSTFESDRYRDDPNSMAMSPVGQSLSRHEYMEEKRATYAAPRSRRNVIIGAVVAAVILIILAVVIPLYFAVIKPNRESSDSSSDGTVTTTGVDGQPTTVPVGNIVKTGGDGSEITMEDGNKFKYSNSYGGTWYHDPSDPYNNNAQAQSWTPALNKSFDYNVDRIHGVNIGGWLTLEPFISPALYEPYASAETPAVDEWTLCENLRKDNNISAIEEHYKTFITEQDFAEIAGAGLNFVRIPIPYWAIEVRGDEPFLANTAWTYFLKAVEWCRKYGLRINLDFHAFPGSQNGWNHSGKFGTINILKGPMGYANAQRSLDYIRIVAEFASQPEYNEIIAMFGVMNEPRGPLIGQDSLSAFYVQAYDVVRTASGVGEGKGPWVNFHDGFFGRPQWDGFLKGGDRVTLDSHPYLCFGGQSGDPMSKRAGEPCGAWGKSVNDSTASFGLNNAGEFSNAVTDCGLYLNGVNLGTRYEGEYPEEGPWPRIGSCDEWTDWTKWDDDMKASVKEFALNSMDALQNWFFWTWKIGDSLASGRVETPAWSYKLGLENGWMPKDPREAIGVCGNTDPFEGSLSAWQTGGEGAGETGDILEKNPWPPATLTDAGSVTSLPSYTPTGSLPTLTQVASFSGATATPTSPSGWTNSDDKAGLMVEISGCNYLDPWVGPNNDPPSPLCN